MRPNTKKMAVMAMLVALSVVLVALLRVPLIPGSPHLEYDMADIPILIGTFAYGPLAGLMLTIIASVIQGLTVSAHSGLYGIVMHIIATGTLVLVAGNLYKLRHTRKGAIMALACGTLAMAGMMLVANHFITPYYLMGIMGVEHAVAQGVADATLLVGVLPFNLLKAGINSVVTFIVYKSVSRHIIKGEFTGQAKKPLDSEA